MRERRRRTTSALATLVLAVLVAAGWLVASHHKNRPSASLRPAHPVTAAMLLQRPQLQPIARSTGTTTWGVSETGNNTGGDGRHSICQRDRFADARGLSTWVRTFAPQHGAGQQLVQTVEVSASPGAAVSAYRTTLGWYADCGAARARLVRAYRVDGLGEQAQALELSLPDGGRYFVTVARNGSLTQSTVLRAASPKPSTMAALARVSSTGMQGLCPASATSSCQATPATLHATAPPASGEPAGTLAAGDLPAMAGLRLPWVGTQPVHGGPNLAATPCDRADFATAGADPSSRSYLIPRAGLPSRFGLTETYGTFASDRAAGSFLASVRHRMATCAKRQLGTHVSHHRDSRVRGTTYSFWRLRIELNAHHGALVYWMGVVRSGAHVAQVSFTPTPGRDVDAGAFGALVARAGQRLGEL